MPVAVTRHPSPTFRPRRRKNVLPFHEKAPCVSIYVYPTRSFESLDSANESTLFMPDSTRLVYSTTPSLGNGSVEDTGRQAFTRA